MFDRAGGSEARPPLGEVAASLGFRRVEIVRFTVDAGRTVAEVTGAVHRTPRTVRVPLRLAARLVAAGAPVRVDATTGAEA